MSAHKAHHYATVGVDGGPSVTVFFRRRWQAWLVHRLLEVSVAAQPGGAR